MSLRLAEMREKKGLKQVELASRIGVSRSHMANLESGTRDIDLITLRKCARALDCSVADILLPEDVPDRPTGDEAQLLAELRSAADYDPGLVVIAARDVVRAAKELRTAMSAPKALEGSPRLAADLADRWNTLGEKDREKLLVLLDSARDFSVR